MTKQSSQHEYEVARLEKKHSKQSFSCGHAELDKYLQTQAGQDTKKQISVTHVLTQLESNEVIGYYTLATIGIIPGELPESVIKKLPKYPQLPGVLLARLAVDKKFQGQKIGKFLLIDALKRSADISDQIGIIAIVVDAKDENASDFYKNYGFIECPENNRKLFLTMQTVKQLNV
jgi:GNAT superfamily N-acetyltransferase